MKLPSFSPVALCLATWPILSGSAQAALVTQFQSALQPTSPAAGWEYLWNSNGAIGDPVNYTPLLPTTANQVWYDNDGTAGLPGADPGRFIYLGKSTWQPTLYGGHPGLGAQQAGSGGVERYAIAAYTLSAGGEIRIANSLLTNVDPIAGGSVDGLSLKVFVNNNATPIISTTTAAGVGNVASFNRSLGALNAGDKIYVAVGSRDNDTDDGFTLQYDIVAEGEPSATITVDPRATYLKPVNGGETLTQVQPARIVNLATGLPFAVTAGDYLRIQAVGEFDYDAADASSGGPFGDGSLRHAYGVFSSSNVLAAVDEIVRVPGATPVVLGSVDPAVTNVQNEISQDFFIPSDSVSGKGAIVRVPAGASHLFLSAADTIWFNNTDADGDYGVRVTRLSPLRFSGDANLDGFVGGEDLLTWQRELGNSDVDSLADADVDGEVNGDDHAIWLVNFGSNSGETGASAVTTTAPEPAGATPILLAGMAGWAAWRRRVIVS